MNLGIYVSNFNDLDLIKEFTQTISNKKDLNITDASIFYDDLGFTPPDINCGMFNSTDLWNFNGLLITTSLETTIRALNIVNNINLCYYYGYENKVHPLPLIGLLRDGIDVIAKSETDAQELYRKTKTKPKIIAKNFKDLIRGIRDE